jgi:hypothetical protein
MSDLTQEEEAFLIKIGQITPTGSTPAQVKKEEDK